ncbi:hypothetical protein AVEN_168685-1 [Araneus ventricosus]|uniref:Uncharacterized protein n=1 Tax=Araneus ventricosus TaxID=182803 RepID=A0A4Y2M583_ARAVE|nr:hypothetical protein AVEN_168685-1 [Araneus ventricosus]
MASLTPTEAAAHQHSLRVYYQIKYWLGNKMIPQDWVCENANSALQLVKTLKSLHPALSCARNPTSERRGAQEIAAVGRSDCFAHFCISIVGTNALTGRFKLLIEMRMTTVS